MGFEAIDQWGSTLEERGRHHPCDDVLADPQRVLFRAVSIDAPPPVVFRWLCQLKLGPYSYDLIDNRARRSPRHLVAGAEQLEVGEAISIFRLASFKTDEHLTLELHGDRAFGDLAMTYAVSPAGAAATRLLVKLLVVSPPGLLGQVLRRVLPLGDLIMMRRQLLNLKGLAETTSAAEIDQEAGPVPKEATEDGVTEMNEPAMTKIGEGRSHDGVRQITPPADLLERTALDDVTYQDCFLVDVGPSISERTAEQWARMIFETAPAKTQQSLVAGWQGLGLQLGPLSSDQHVLGWRVHEADADRVVLAADGCLGISGELVFERQPDMLRYATLVRLDSRGSKAVWNGVEPLHVRMVRQLIARAI